MSRNLFAVCRDGNGLTVKRVPLNDQVQIAISDMFDQQYQSFVRNIKDEIPFEGRWKPDSDECMYIDMPQEALPLLDIATTNPVSIDKIDTANFAQEGIKGLFTNVDTNGGTSILVQQFTGRQSLENKLALIFSSNDFRKISEPAFTLPTSLTCILEEDRIRFKSWGNLRTIFDLTDVYRAATDEDLKTFGQHASIGIDDLDKFIADSDQPMRKMINQVLEEGTLETYTAGNIQQSADQTGLAIEVVNGKITWPAERKSQKEILQFLVECRYLGPLSGTPYVTNSRRQA